MRIARKVVSLAETAIEHEAEVMGVGHGLDGFSAIGEEFGVAAQLLGWLVGIELPQHTREEAGAPPSVVACDEPALLERARETSFLRFERAGHQQALAAGSAQSTFNDFAHRYLGRESCADQSE